MSDQEDDNKSDKPQKPTVTPKIFTRKDADLELKKQLLAGPELFVTQRGSDESLDKLLLKVKLIGGEEFILKEYVTDVLAKYERKFYKEWFYEVAKIFDIDKKLMDEYVKPKIVALFIIQYVYGRFPYKVFKALTRRSKYILPGVRANKLFQYLTKPASEKLDIIIEQVFVIMQKSDTYLDFKMNYSREYEVYIQLELFS